MKSTEDPQIMARRIGDSVRWPIQVPPLPGEALSSWLSRTAFSNGVSLHCLIRETWPGRDLLQRDLDRIPPKDVVDSISGLTGIPRDEIWERTLAGLVGSLFESLQEGPARSKWTLPYGIRRATPHGTQYCPDCLAEDPSPYFRRSWRLAFVTTCPRHNRVLRDSCPHCQHASVLTKGPGRWAEDTAPKAVHICRNCKEDLRVESDRNRFALTTPMSAVFQTTLEEALHAKWVDLKGEGLVHSILFFNGIHQWISLLLKRGRDKKFREELLRQIEWDMANYHLPEKGGKRSIVFETLSVHDRHPIMFMVSWLMDNWPVRFLNICERAKLRLCSALQSSSGDPPHWIYRVVNEHLKCVRTRWAAEANPHWMGLSYDGLGRRILQPRLQRQEERIAFIRSREDLWSCPTELARVMKRAKFYPSNYPMWAAQRNSRRLLEVAMANAEVVPVTDFLGMQTVQGRRWLRLN